MPLPNIDALDIAELLELSVILEKRLEVLRATAANDLRARFEAEARALGLDIHAITPARSRGRPRMSGRSIKNGVSRGSPEGEPNE